jgi:hypothetical protein
MRRLNPDDDADDDSQPVMVPRNGKALAPTAPERARRLRRHVIVTLRSSRRRQDCGTPTGSAAAEPDGFVAEVARTACGLCKGWCCKGGGDHGYLDEQTIARVRGERPALTARAVLLLYLGQVPSIGYQGSCVFHASQGCTLPRSLRSDVCNTYFCAGLAAFLDEADTSTPAMVIAGEGAGIRTARVPAPSRRLPR